MNKRTITLSANEQELRMTCPIPVVSDTVNYIEAVFDLGENWQGFDSVRAVWSDGYTKPIATVLDAEGKTFVPHEVMTVTRMVKVNLVGSIVNNDVLTDRLTTNPVDAVNVRIKALVNGTETAEVTPSQFEQFVAQVIDAVEQVTGMTAEAETLPSGSQATARYEDGVLTIGIPQGAKGEDGNGIASVVMNADYTLTINFTDGTSMTTTSIRGAKGNGIRSIAKTGTSGLVDTYTITFDDGNTTTYTVTNGEKGDKGDTGATPSFSIGTVETLAPTESATATITGTDENPVLNLGIPQGKDGVVPDLESILPQDSASGSIASFPDGSDLLPAKSLKVSLEPIQDLNGYDKPWSGGNGKNKASVNELTGVGWAESNAELLASFNSLPVGTYTVSFDVKVTSATKTGAWHDGIVVLNPNENVLRYNNFSADPTVGFTDTLTYTFTLDASQVGAFTSCYVYGCGSNQQGKMGEATLSSIQIESGSSRTSFAPYSNICPISGHTEVEANVTGKNLLDPNSITGALSGTKNSYFAEFSTPYKLKAGTTYTLSLDVVSDVEPFLFSVGLGNKSGAYAQDLTSVSGLSSGRVSITFRPTEQTLSRYQYFKFRCPRYYTIQTFTYSISNIQLEKGATATAYEPYQGNTYTTALGRTVYGGDVEQVGGELTDKMGMVDLGDLAWSYNSTNKRFLAVLSSKATTRVMPNALCSAYQILIWGNAQGDVTKDKAVFMNGTHVSVRDTDYTDATAFKQAMSGVQLVYELATPQTYQLTPQEISLLQGENNVWSDGDVTVVYYADIQRYIEKKLG